MNIRQVLRIVAVSGILVVPVLGQQTPVAGETANLITPNTASLAVTLPATATATFVVPYVPVDTVDITKLTGDDLQVTMDGAPVAVAANDIVVDNDAALGLLRVTVAVDKFVINGTYNVVLKVQVGSNAQLITMAIARPAAELQGDTTINITRTVWFPEIGLGGEHEDKPGIELTAGDKTRISALVLKATGSDPQFVSVNDGSSNSAKSAGGRVVTITFAQPLDPGKTADLVATLSTDFPLGTVDRTVEIRAPQLAQPITLTFHVTSRREPVLIVVFVILGLLLGLVARRLPPIVQQRRTALALVNSTRSQLDGLRNRYHDKTFRDALGTAAATLDRHWFVPSSTLTTKANAAITAANTALDELDARLAPGLKVLADTEAIVSTHWDLPPAVLLKVVEVRDLVDKARHQADNGDAINLTATAHDIDNGLTSITTEVIDDNAELKSTLEQIVNQLKSVSDPNFVAMSAVFERLADRVVDPAASAPVIDYLKLSDTLEQHTRSALAQTKTILARYSSRHGAQPGFDDVLTHVTDVLNQPTRGALNGFASILDQLITQVDLVHGDSHVDEVGLSVATPPRLEAALRYSPRTDRMAMNASAVIWGTAAVLTAILRFVVLTILLVLVSYRWFSDDWRGTLAQISTVLVWAFGVDVTVSLVTQVASSNPLAPGAAGGATAGVVVVRGGQSPADSAPSASRSGAVMVSPPVAELSQSRDDVLPAIAGATISADTAAAARRADANKPTSSAREVLLGAGNGDDTPAVTPKGLAPPGR